MAKRTRVHRSWAVDYDYEHKLNAEHLEFLEKFTGEFYRNEFEGKPLHNTDFLISEVFSAENAANRDIFTAPPKTVTQHRAAIPDHRPSIKCRFYFESDYCLKSANPENHIVEIIDENQRATETKCVIVQLNSRRFAS